jgi:hypothetical protein
MNIGEYFFPLGRRPRITDLATVSLGASVFLAVAAINIGMFSPLAAAANEWRPLTVATLNGMIDVEESDSGNEIFIRGSKFRYRLEFDSKLTASLERLPLEKLKPAPGIIPQSSATDGKHDIRSALFVGPTARYHHGILGDAIEAGALAVERRDGGRVLFTLDEESVFEDLTPRLHDIDGDGRDEVVVVRSYLDWGAALSVFGLRDGELVQIAEADPIGRPHRWLNPIGVADFNGDGQVELAAVITPHIGGWIVLYRHDGQHLREIDRWLGYSNHAIGSAVLGMSTVVDANGDGLLDIILPTQDRSVLKAVTLIDGELAELQSVSNASAITTSIVAIDLDGNGLEEIIYGLDDGSLVVIRR